MITLESDRLVFRFPELHESASFQSDFQRTCRIPDEDRHYPLPAGLGRFPLRHVDDFAATLNDSTRQRGGVMLPMHTSEAMWVNFPARAELQYPFAVKIAAGKVNALTGKAWSPALGDSPQDYLVVPPQPWLDGFVMTEGVVRQFIAERLGEGFTVEEQLTGAAEFGGLQIIAYPMEVDRYLASIWRPEVARRRKQIQRSLKSARDRLDELGQRIAEANAELVRVLEGCKRGDVDCMRDLESLTERARELATTVEELDFYVSTPCRSLSLEESSVDTMGMAAGGQMRQQVYKDPYGIDAWDQSVSSRCFVSILSANSWQRVTGEAPPLEGLTAWDYENANLPWFDYYDPKHSPLGGVSALANVESLAGLKAAGGRSLPGNDGFETSVPKRLGSPQAAKSTMVRESDI